MTLTQDGATEAPVMPWHPAQPHCELAADVRWWVGSPLALGLFGQLALDQVAYRRVAAAVDASGRFAANFTDRAIRSYLWSGPMMFGSSLLDLCVDAGGGIGRITVLEPRLRRWRR